MSSRLLFAILYLYLLVPGAELLAQGASPSQAGALPRLVIIHGRKVRTSDPEGLAREWNQALDRGLVQAVGDASFIPMAARSFVYYGDVFRPGKPDYHDNCPDSLFRATRNDPAQLATPDPRHEREENGANAGLRLARALTRFLPQGWKYGVVMQFTRDTKDYIHEGAISCSVRNIIHDTLTSDTTRPTVVLAHSQGALLVYEYLANNEGWVHIDGLVSAGSQFGFDRLMLDFGGKRGPRGAGFRTPSGTPIWYNVYDAQDPVAYSMSDERTSSRYNPNSGLVDLKEVRIRNREDFRHSAVGYLSHPSTALAVADTWCRSFKDSPPPKCMEVREQAKALSDEKKRRPGWVEALSVPLSITPIAAVLWAGIKVAK